MRRSLVAATTAWLSAAGAWGAETLVRLDTPVVAADYVVDPATGSPCGGEARLAFGLGAAATVTAYVEGRPVAGTLEDGVLLPVGGRRVTAGDHVLVLRAGTLAGPGESAGLRLEARGDAGQSGVAEARIAGDVVNRAVLPVGRIFVAGVDLLDGHLTLRATDLKLSGRHLALEATRTYSSAGRGLAGLLGGGWFLNYESGLAAFPACGLYVVTAADGSSQAFRSKDEGRTFSPQRGYHTALLRGPDGAFRFVDKAGIRHRFAAAPGPNGRHRLESIEEPHGDRIELRYDRRGRPIEADEVHEEAPGVRLVARALVFAYTTAGGRDRIRSIEAGRLGLRVDYGYDADGLLTDAAVWDEDKPGTSVESYRYSAQEAPEARQLVAWIDAKNKRTEYRYLEDRDALPGEGKAPWLLLFGRHELVAEATEVEPGKRRSTTWFGYDHSGGLEDVFKTTVRQAGASPSAYTLNRDGSPLQIAEADARGRHVWQMEWTRGDVLKREELDNRGYHAHWEYDERGNLTTDRTREKKEAAERVVTYAYDPSYNKLVLKKDADGKVSTWSIDPRTGDLVAQTGSDGKTTGYRYDGRGNLVETRHPDGGRTLFLDHDSFGNATRIVGPAGKVQRREFDLRGRRYADPAPAASPSPSPAPRK